MGKGNDRRVVCDSAPYMEHTDLGRVREVFGDAYILDAINGTSRRVIDQTVRRDIVADASLARNDRAMKEIVIGRALGNRKARTTRVTVVEKIVQKFVANDGTMFDTLVEVLAHNKMLAVEATL